MVVKKLAGILVASSGADTIVDKMREKQTVKRGLKGAGVLLRPRNRVVM